MEKFLVNNNTSLIFYTVSLETTDNPNDVDINIAKTVSKLTSPIVIIVAILMVFIFSPTIIIGNSLVLISIYRFKRLRTPSNYLVMSLATSDLGIGIYMPIGMYMELGGFNKLSPRICLLNYGVAISLCCVSVMVMVAIAVDRFTSLARPLRYNNLITHTAVERYVIVFWIYSVLVGFSPFSYYLIYHLEFNFFGYPSCSFSGLVARPIQLFMFCAVYGPCACILLICYGYIYLVARDHARAISEIRHSLHYGTNPPRYGIALATTAGLFLTLWLPFQICMLMDVFLGTNILSQWIMIYLALPILSNSAFNPWIYGYRNAELRFAVHKVIDDTLTLLGLNYRSHQISEPVPPSIEATAGDPASFNNNGKKEYYNWKPDDDFLLVPIAKPESSGFLSESESYKLKENTKKVLAQRPILKGSRSMIETFAVHNKSDWIFNGKQIGMMNGASIV